MHAGRRIHEPTQVTWPTTTVWISSHQPMDPEVEVHSYQEYEHEFHQKMKAVGLPLDWDYDEEGNQIPKK